MGFLTKPSITQVDPNPQSVQGLQGGIADFLMGQFDGSGQNPFAGMTSDLQRGATNSMMQFMNANPEQQTFEAMQPGLMEIFGGGQAARIGEAGLPVFARQLQESLGGLASGAQGRFGTTFERQGVDLASRAAQDFALLQQQALMQEMQTRLGAGGLMGSLASQAGNGAFGRAATGAQVGMAQTQQQIDPMLQMLLGGMGFARPAQMDTVVGSSPLDKLIDGGLAAFMMSQGGFGGGGGS